MFLTRLTEDKNLVRDTNSDSHFCAIFQPVDSKKKTVFLLDHKKARDWIPPGGHIDIDETPIDTVKREMFEELQYTITTEKIELFDIVKKHTNNVTCKIHYDFWFLVFMEQTEFIVDKKEARDFGWFSFEEAVKKIKTPEFNAIMRKVRDVI